MNKKPNGIHVNGQYYNWSLYRDYQTGIEWLNIWCHGQPFYSQPILDDDTIRNISIIIKNRLKE